MEDLPSEYIILNSHPQSSGERTDCNDAAIQQSEILATAIVPFVGIGQYPATLAGGYVMWYYENDDPNRLELKLVHRWAQFLEKDAVERWEQGNDEEDEAEICMDYNLEVEELGTRVT
jgi:hypothetical protein